MDETQTANTTTGRRRLRLAAIALSSAAAIGIVAGMNTGPATSAASSTAPVVGTPSPGYADLIERVMPAVVSVTVKRAAGPETVTGWREFGPEGGADREMFERFMERFFGERGAQPFQMPPQMRPEMPRGMPMAMSRPTTT